MPALSPQEIAEIRKQYNIQPVKTPAASGGADETYRNARTERLKALRTQQPAQGAAPEQEQGFFSRVGSDLKKRANEAFDTLGEAARGEITPVESAGRIVGQGLAAGGDIVGEGLTSAYRTVVPDKAQDVIERGVSRAAQAVGLPKAMEKYEKFAEANPRAAKNVEAIANIASAFPAGKGAQVAGRAVKEGAEEAVGQVGKQIAKSAVSSVDKRVDAAIMKAIKPSVTSIDTATRRQFYLDRAKQAVNAIVENEPNLKLVDEFGEAVATPKSLNQLSDAIEQTKRSVFKKYSGQAAKAGEKGALVELDTAAKELEAMASSVALQDKDPDLVNKILQKADILKKRGVYTPEQAQEAIKLYNDSLEAFYKNPSYETASRAAADAVVANNLRQTLDQAISSLEGPGYQELKNTYGALKTIEKDVARRALVDARKNAKGLLDFTDLGTGAAAVDAILSMNPTKLASAATAGLLKRTYKKLNDPNEIIKKMFDEVKNAKAKSSKFKVYSPGSKFVPVTPTDEQKAAGRAIMENVKQQNAAMSTDLLNKK